MPKDEQRGVVQPYIMIMQCIAIVLPLAARLQSPVLLNAMAGLSALVGRHRDRHLFAPKSKSGLIPARGVVDLVCGRNRLVLDAAEGRPPRVRCPPVSSPPPRTGRPSIRHHEHPDVDLRGASVDDNSTLV